MQSVNRTQPRPTRPRGGTCVRLLLFCFFAGHAVAQEWPAWPVKFIVSQAPGSPPDIVARIVVTAFRRSGTGGVENRPGPNAWRAAAAVGAPIYLFMPPPPRSSPTRSPQGPAYDPPKDFIPVAMIAKSLMVIADPSVSEDARGTGRARQGAAGQARRGQ